MMYEHGLLHINPMIFWGLTIVGFGAIITLVDMVATMRSDLAAAEARLDDLWHTTKANLWELNNFLNNKGDGVEQLATVLGYDPIYYNNKSPKIIGFTKLAKKSVKTPANGRDV